MILLDTHIWYWWVDQPSKLSATQTNRLRVNEPLGLGVSVFSCWEMALLIARGRVRVTSTLNVWMRRALAYPGICLLPLTPEIALEANQLPGIFHRDPADQILVATARILGISMLTADAKILAYPDVAILV